MDITDKQQQLWQQLGHNLAATPQIRQLALTYYQQYSHAHSFPPDKAPLLLQVAYFLSQKSHIVHDREGKPLKGIALSANNILRDHSNHQEFLYHLKQMLRTVKVPPQATHLEAQITRLSKTLSTSLVFLNKLNSTFKKLHIGQRNTVTQEDKEHQKRQLWLLFINCKSFLNCSDLVETTCLMSCLFGLYVRAKYQQEGTFSIFLGEQSDGVTLDSQLSEITHALQEYFHIRDGETYARVETLFYSYVNSLTSIIDTSCLFSKNQTLKNSQLLNKKYLKSLASDDLDESAMLKNQSQCLYAKKNTPFGRNKILAPRHNALLSCRVLNYEWDTVPASQDISTQAKPTKALLPRIKMVATPHTTLIRATPVSEAMQMYNWLLDISRRQTEVKPDRQAAEDMLSMMEKDEVRKHSEQHLDLLVGLWRQGLQHSGKDIDASLLLVAANLVLHIINLPSYDAEQGMRHLNLRGLQVWQALDFYLNHDKQMPLPVKLHIHSLESHFIKRLCWEDREVALILAETIEDKQQRLAKRVIHQCANEIQFLCKRLELNNSCEDISFALTQKALADEQELIWGRTLDQIIVCSVYGACKVKRNQLKLTEIIRCYGDVFELSARELEDLGEHARVSEQEQGIIPFYNKVFMPALKGFMYELRQSASEQNKEGQVRSLVAQGAFCLTSPQMTMQFAYSESPLLRPRLKDIANTTAPRDKQYTLKDIASKFGKFGGQDTLRSTRKLKHSVRN